MKHAWRAPAFVTIVSVFAAAGCSSTQPDSIDTRGATLAFNAKATVALYDCYEEWQDTTGPDGIPDGIPDEKINDSLQCVRATENGLPLTAARDVPWRYTLVITVVRAGTTNEQILTSTDGVPGFDIEGVSLTNYDVGDSAAVPENFFNTETGTYYLNGRRLSTGNLSYLTNAGVETGIPNILNVYPTFNFDLNTGDTVIVRAVKLYLFQAPSGSPVYEDIRLSAEFKISGVDVTAHSTPEGNPPTSPPEDATGITFSFTVQ
jgi:hypothetical protein